MVNSRRFKNGSGIGVSNKSFHYTKPEMARRLLALVDFKGGDVVIDAGSGKNKVWYKHLPKFVQKYECEIEDNCDFLKWNTYVDWTVGNPPYRLGWKFIEHAAKISHKGIAFLLSLRAFNMLTPQRLEWLKASGFIISNIHIVNDKRWFGRYYFVIFKKTENDCTRISWDTKTY